MNRRHVDKERRANLIRVLCVKFSLTRSHPGIMHYAYFAAATADSRETGVTNLNALLKLPVCLASILSQMAAVK